MNVSVYATCCERMFEGFLNSVGKTRKTTFFADLSIAEWCEGAKGVKDTYKRVIKAWKNDVVYMAEFVVALNQKIWMHYEQNRELAKVIMTCGWNVITFVESISKVRICHITMII